MDKQQINQIRAKVQIPKALAAATNRIVTAGRKVMYSPQTRKLVMDSLKGTAPISQRIGKAISDLMVLLYMQSNKSLPPQLIAPCTVLLTCDAVEFMMDAGEQVDIGEALELATTMTLERFGVKPDQLQQILGKLGPGDLDRLMSMPPKRGAQPGQQAPGMVGG